MSNPLKIKAVIFDIDGTLSSGISWMKITRELRESVPDHLKIYEDFKNNRLTLTEGKNAILTLWRGKDGTLHKEQLLKLFQSWKLKEDAGDLFLYLKRKGYLTCLITGSVDLFAEIVAQKLKADFWYANSILIWDEKNTLKDFTYEPYAEKKKREQLSQFCRTHALRPDECAVVGDDTNDAELFKATHYSIVVESPTSSALEELAWRKVKTLAEIKKIL